jgi:glycosyltransferase involved in cell wall biosynthesis
MLVSGWRPDIVQFEFHLMAQYAAAVEAPHVARVLVQHESGAAASAERCDHSGLLNRPAAFADHLAWRRYEKRTIPTFDQVVTFTDTEAEAMRRAHGTARVTTIPLGIRVPEAPLSPGSGHTILFVGSFLHYPNEDAAIRLASRILPRVRQRVPDATLTLVGSYPSARIGALASPHVRVFGSVDLVRPYLDEAAVFAAPLRFGGGMRVKVLEALAAGKAVVASTKAVDGLSVTEGVNVRLANSDDDFADTVVELFDCEPRRLALADAGRQWAVAHATSRDMANAFRAVYDTVVRHRPGSGQHVQSGTAVPVA